jgi:methionine sulfoxide reductase heme-binding subunit
VSLAQTLDHGWWLASRSAGVVAYLLLSASVVLGLAMALRLAPPRLAPTVRVVHERIALVALGAVAAHGLLLLGDGFLRPRLTDVLIPFAIGYRPAWTGIGILAGYLAAGLSLTYYARRRIGARRWRAAHRLIPVAWAMAAVHVLGAGTDAGSLWLQVPLALTMSAVLTLLGHRVLAGRPVRGAGPPRRAPVPAAAAAAAAAAAPTPPMPVARPAMAAAREEPATAVAPSPNAYRPLWARDPSPPAR